MKKWILTILGIIVLLGGISIQQSSTVYAVDQSVTLSGTTTANNQGAYRVTEVKETNNLLYGVRHFKHYAESTTSLSIGGNADGAHGKVNVPFQPGIMYEQQVNVFEVPSTKGVKIVSWANLNNNRWSLNNVRALARDYETKNPGWSVIGAINGDFFDIGASGNLPYQTTGAHGANGHFYKTTSTRLLGFANDGSVNSLIGDVSPKRTTTMKLAIYNNNNEIVSTFNVNQYNQLPGTNQTSVFYGTYNDDKIYVPITMESGANTGFLVSQAELALPNRPNDFYGIGTISQLVENASIGVGQFGIVTNNESVLQALEVGTRIRVQWEWRDEFANIDSATGIGPTFLRNSEYDPNSIAQRTDLGQRHPRTVIGRKSDGTIVMAVIDGRQGNNAEHGMHGVHVSEMAAIMRRYGAVEAYNLDGGGSSTFVVKKGNDFVVMNSPSDGWERSNSNALLIVTKDPIITISGVQSTTTAIDFNISVDDMAGHDMQETYVRIGNTNAKIENGKAVFTGLRADNTYDYLIRYRDSSGRLVDLKDVGTVQTLKTTPVFRKINIIENETNYQFIADYTDRGNASNLGQANLIINGLNFSLSGGSLIVEKSVLGGSIEELLLQYTIDLNNNQITHHEIRNPQYRATMMLNTFIDEVKYKIERIFW